ncbi:MAG: GntR family transcriptional regulator [Anaerolineaceae bacterium]|nr:GntR family transcriptional regulator [Anaerolineaceae bacterium]
MTDLINKQTLSEQIYKILRTDILTQEIKSGQKLTLQSLKDRFKVSHTPIRDALTRLVEDDLVIYYSNVGITVVSLSENDAREIFQLSGDLDCLAMRYCCAGSRKETFLAEMDDIVNRSAKYLTKKQYKQWGDLSDHFHLIMYQYADNTRLERAAQKLRAQITLLSNLYQLENNYVEQIQNEHELVNQLLQDGKIEEAIKCMREHLDHDMTYAIEAIG